MSEKPSKSSKKNPDQKTTDAALFRRARRHAAQFGRVTLFDVVSEEWVSTCIEIPNAIGAGDSAKEAEKELTENLAVHFAYLDEIGRAWPEPTSSPRSEQLNIRLTVQEKAEFEAAAKRLGLSSVADLIRMIVLEKIRESDGGRKAG